jgi:hypothetical protein
MEVHGEDDVLVNLMECMGCRDGAKKKKNGQGPKYINIFIYFSIFTVFFFTIFWLFLIN